MKVLLSQADRGIAKAHSPSPLESAKSGMGSGGKLQDQNQDQGSGYQTQGTEALLVTVLQSVRQ